MEPSEQFGISATDSEKAQVNVRTPVDTLTPFPDAPLSLPIPQLTDEQWTSLGIVVSNFIDVNLGNRAALDDALDTWNAVYEMRTVRRNIPWEGASDMTLPVACAAMDELVSRIAGSALVPRPYTVHGDDALSTPYSNQIEQFFNAEWDRNNSYDPHEACIRLAARDGTAIMEILYELSTREEMRVATEPLLDDEGQAILDDDGNPRTIKVAKNIKYIEYDAPRERDVDLKSFLLIPNFAPSVAAADAAAVKTWMSEHACMKMVNAGIFRESQVDAALRYTSTGMGERSTDPQGNSQYTVDGMINVADTAIAPPEGIGMTRGPIEVYRYHTSQFDLNGDGVPEENVLWIHYRSRKLLGFAPFEYHAGRPFKVLQLFPRSKLIYGFSVIERGLAIQEEVDTQHNSRLDLLDLLLRPNRYRTSNARFRETDRRWGPDTEVEVQQPTDFGFVPSPSVPDASPQEEQLLLSYLDRVVGAPQAAAMALPSGARRSAREAQQNAAIQGMQSNMVISRVRRWMRDIVVYKRRLYSQYGTTQMETVDVSAAGSQRVVLPRELLNLNFTLSIVGLGGPLDKEGRKQDIAMVTQLLLSTPLQALIVGNMPRLWNLARMNLETYDFPDVTSIIGTAEEAAQLAQAQQQGQQQQQQIQALMQVLSHGSFPSKGGPPAAKGSPVPA